MAAAATGSDSFSSGSMLSDSDLETINNEELVTFHSLNTMYSNKKDLVAFYTLGNAVDHSPQDWIGLFRNGWQTLYDFSAYQWLNLDLIHVSEPRKRRTIFPQADIGELFGRFQFLYVSGKEDVLGASECFDVGLCDLVPSSESFSLLQDKVPSSLSLISLGSQSSLSDDSSVTSEKTSEVSKDAQLPKPASSKPESFALVSQNDYYSLSDLVMENSLGGMVNKLHFVQPEDWRSLLEEYEPVRQICLTPRRKGKRFIEEIPPNISEIADVASGQASSCSDLVVSDNNASRFERSGALIFNLRPQGFSVSHSQLQMFHPKLLVSIMEEMNHVVAAAADSQIKEAIRVPRLHQWFSADSGICEPRPFSFLPKRLALPDCSLSHKAKSELKLKALECSKNIVFDFQGREPEGKSQNLFQPASQPTPREVTSPKCEDRKKKPKTSSSSASELNSRKKRWVQQSKTKSSREKQELMLQEALTLMSKAPGSSSMSTETEEVSLSTQPSADKGRKRRCHNNAFISKAKRRCINHRTPTPVVLHPLSVDDDEGYGSQEEEEEEKDSEIFTSTCQRESVELLNLALTEALKNNAELHSQMTQVVANKSAVVADGATSTQGLHKETPTQCDKPITSGKAVNTEKQKKRDAAANTSQTAKKDSPVQCSNSRRGKGTNTEKKIERHAASNTPTVVKTDMPSQCVTTSAKSVNTAPTLPTKDSGSNTPENSRTAVPKTSILQPECSLYPQNQLVSLDLTVHSGRSPVEDADGGSGEWKKVSSKRMIRLQKLILRKKEEFRSLRENAENYEKRTRNLEASLQSARSALSAETRKRVEAQKDLRELRIKFWELLAFRKSQPWQQNANENTNKVAYDGKPKENTPSTESELASSDCVNHSAERTQEVQAKPIKPKSKQENIQEKLTKSKQSSTAPSSENAKSNQLERNEEHQLERNKGLHKKQTSSMRDPPKLTNAVPVMATAKINGVTVVQDNSEVKRTSCGAISFRKFLIPAMTALAETFSPSKSKTKTPSPSSSSNESDRNAPPKGAKSSSSNNSAFAKVTVSISAGMPSCGGGTKSPSSSAKAQKAGSGKGRSSSGSKRSASRGEGEKKGKPAAAAKSRGKPPLQESFQNSSSDITVRRRRSPTSLRNPAKLVEVLPSPIALPFPMTSDSVSTPSRTELPKEQESRELKKEKWRPLKIAAQEGCVKGDDAMSDVTRAYDARPVSVSVVTQQPGCVGHGRAVNSSAGAEPETFTRDHYAKAVLTRPFAQQPLAVRDVTNSVTSSSHVPDVIPSSTCGSLFSWGKQTNQTKPSNSNPSSFSPLSSFLHYPALFTTPTHPIPLRPAPSTTPLPAFPSLAFPLPTKTTTTPCLPVFTALPPRLLPHPSFSATLGDKGKCQHHQLKQQQQQQQQRHYLHLQHHQRQQQQQQQQQPMSLPPPPRALHFDWVRACSDTKGVRRQIRQGRCFTCGMEFSPSVDRYLVEEHLYFHHTFTE